MEFIDIVDFDFPNPQDYGLSKAFRVGKDIFMYPRPDKDPRHPSISALRGKSEIIHNLRRFDLVYLPTYEADVELITSVVKKGKSFVISLSDIVCRHGSDRAVMLHRIKRFLQFCRSYKAKVVIASMARSICEVRSPGEVAGIAEWMGLDRNQALKAMSWKP